MPSITELPPDQAEEATAEETIKMDQKDILTSSPEEDTEEAQRYRDQGNTLFREQKDYEGALEYYERAIAICPDDRKDLHALYWGNVSACKFQLKQYKEAVEACTKALELDQSHIRARARRIAANEKIDTWSALEDAIADIKKLQEYWKAKEEAKDAVDRKGANEDDQAVQKELTKLNNQLSRLLPRLKIKQEEETQQMFGKLKDMGNSLLGKFGLSLDNFNMQKTPEGGYTMNYGDK